MASDLSFANAPRVADHRRGRIGQAARETVAMAQGDRVAAASPGLPRMGAGE